MSTCNSSWKGHEALHRGDPLIGDHRHRIRVILPYQGDHQSSLLNKAHLFVNRLCYLKESRLCMFFFFFKCTVTCKI